MKYLVAMLVVGAASLGAQAEPPTDRIPVHESFSIASSVMHETRPINVHLPRAYGRNSTVRLPVLYMPDGALDEDFPHVVNTVDSLIELGRIRPVIVVGIPNTMRRRDLTGPTRIASDSQAAPQVGGSALFRQFIRDELFPAIDARYRTTRERSIIGESLAGLFVVETFLFEPHMFEHSIAFDPSVWWNAGFLVGPSAPLPPAAALAGRALYLSSSIDDIDGDTARLAARLRSHPAKEFTFTYQPRGDLTHGTIFRAMAPEAIAMVLH